MAQRLAWASPVQAWGHAPRLKPDIGGSWQSMIILTGICYCRRSRRGLLMPSFCALHWLCIFARLLSFLGWVRGDRSLAGFIPIGMGQMITRRLRPVHACVVCLPPQILLLTQPRLAGHNILSCLCWGDVPKSDKPCTRLCMQRTSVRWRDCQKKY
jgi:hypothetical protein